MKLIRQGHKIMSSIDSSLLLKVEEAGRTCYKSEDRITKGSAEKFIRMLINKGHESVLEHSSITVRFITDRGVTHEIVRHRLSSFSQESTRYCNYHSDKHGSQCTFIIPNWAYNIKEGEYPTIWDDDKENKLHGTAYDFSGGLPDWFGRSTFEEDLWFNTMANLEHDYNGLIENGMKPQDARSVLPNSLKTEIVVTANIRQWRTIFKQRTSQAAHPMMRNLMIPLLEELKHNEFTKPFFDDIKC